MPPKKPKNGGAKNVPGASKAPRTNYSDRDKRILFEIIKTMDAGKVYQILLDNIQASPQDKFDLWQKITAQFNEATGRSTERVALRKWWGRLNGQIRKAHDLEALNREAEDRQLRENCSRTGSGHPPLIPQEVDGDIIAAEDELGANSSSEEIVMPSLEPIRRIAGAFNGAPASSGSDLWVPGRSTPRPSTPSSAAEPVPGRPTQRPRPSAAAAAAMLAAAARGPGTSHSNNTNEPSRPARSSSLTPPPVYTDTDDENFTPNPSILLIDNNRAARDGGNQNGRLVDPVLDTETPRPKKKKKRQSRIQAATEFYQKSLKIKAKQYEFRLGISKQTANIKAVQLRLVEEEAARGNIDYVLPFPRVTFPDPNISSSSEEGDSDEN